MGGWKAREDATGSNVDCTISIVYCCPGLTQIDYDCLSFTRIARERFKAIYSANIEVTAVLPNVVR
jgi:hypothetical protein